MTRDTKAKATGKCDRVKARHGNASEGPNGLDTQAREGIAGPTMIEMLDWSSGFAMEADPVWRLEVNGYCADFPSEKAASNFKAAILSLLKGMGGEQEHDPAWLKLPLAEGVETIGGAAMFGYALAAKDASADAPLRPVEQDSGCSDLAKAARALLDACYDADAVEDLPLNIDGSLLDALREALDA